SELLRGVEVRAIDGPADVEIAAVVADSRLVKPGSLFVDIAGFQTDGAKFVDAALAKGAAAVAGEEGPHPAFGHPLPEGEGLVPPGPLPLGEGPRSGGEGALATYVRVANARQALALIAANFYG